MTQQVSSWRQSYLMLFTLLVFLLGQLSQAGRCLDARGLQPVQGKMPVAVW